MRTVLTDKELQRFKRWLTDRGAEILPVTNPYEVLRFRGSEVGVLYTTGKSNSSYFTNAYQCFKHNKSWDGRPVRTGRKPGYIKEKKQLLKRDGTLCFVCKTEMHDDITLEHLVPLTAGGGNKLSNMVLVHEACNQMLDNKPLNEKIDLIVQYRQQYENADFEPGTPPWD